MFTHVFVAVEQGLEGHFVAPAIHNENGHGSVTQIEVLIRKVVGAVSTRMINNVVCSKW